MEKIDFKKTLPGCKATDHELRIVQIPSRQYLTIDGHGDLNTSQEFTEPETLVPLHKEFFPEHDPKLTGEHHEIYLSDFRRVSSEKLRTNSRQPVKRV